MKHKAPAWLTDEGKAFWRRNIDRIPAGASLDPFALLCSCWEQWKAIDPTSDSKLAVLHQSLSKQITTLSKLYKLFDTSKPDEEPAKDDDDGLFT